MDPPELISNASYWQYKEDTSYALKWVEQTAKSYGWKPQPAKQAMPRASPVPTTGTQSSDSTNAPDATAASGRLKGKARKAAKEKAAAQASAAIEKEKQYEEEKGVVYSAQEILNQAQVISTHLSKSGHEGSPPPASVMHALGRAIKLRQSFSDWFKISRPDDHKSNIAHQHFVKVLEKIASLFQEAARKTAAHSNQATAKNTISGANRAGKQNFYESLPQQLTHEERDDHPVQSARSPVPSSTKATATSDRNYHMEIRDSQENAFMVFTLFIDLQNLKTAIKSVWQRCFEDGTDLVVAHLLTAQAVDFVQRSEKSVLSCLGTSNTQREGGHQEHSWSFPGTYCHLLDTLRDPTNVEAVLQFEEASLGTEKGGGTINMSNLTFTFSARRLSSITSSKLENFVFVTPLLRQFRDDTFTLLDDDVEKVLDRDRSLCHLLLGLVCEGIITSSTDYAEFGHLQKHALSARHDPIVRSLLPLWENQEVSLTSVFTAEIMVDIKDVCNAFPSFISNRDETSDHYLCLVGLQRDTQHTEKGPFARAFSMNSSYDSLMTTKGQAVTLLPSIAGPSGPVLENRAGVKGIEANCEQYLLKLFTEQALLPLKYTKDEYRRYGLFNFFFQPPLDYVSKYYPTFLTHRETFLQGLTESLALDILNADKYVVGAMAHLYNASRHLKIGNLRWPAMDRLIDLHKVALFAEEPPTTPIAMSRSFTHRYWGPQRKMSSSDRMRIMNRAVTRMRYSETAEALNEHWRTAGHTPFWHTLESKVLALEADKKKKAARKGTPTTQPSFIDILPAMEAYLKEQVQTMHMHVDYLEIDRVSVDFQARLVKHARSVFEPQPYRRLREDPADRWTSIDFVSEAFDQEAHLEGTKAKLGRDPSKLPPQDCDYLQDSINCLAGVLKANGIGVSPDVGTADGEEAVNEPVSLSRYRMRSLEDGPTQRIYVRNCDVCNRSHYTHTCT